MSFMRYFPTAFLALWMFVGITASPHADVVEFKHRGLTIAGKPLPPGVTYDISIIGPKEGAETIRKALDVLYEQSTFNAEAIDKLKAAGNVFIVYDPTFPPRELSQVTIAAFIPRYFQEQGTAKDFVSVVSRYGAKWAPRELAPILAHELTGHGMQRLRGRLGRVREVDIECEAYLYQEKAYQDLGFDKSSKEMIDFRQVLERHWCADFRTWLKANKPSGLAHWDKLNPDVPKILQDYLVYTDALMKSGVAGRAVFNAQKKQRQADANRLRQLSNSQNPDDHYELARILKTGVGAKADPEQSLVWMNKAAQGGHLAAKYELGVAYFQGKVLKQNVNKAVELITRAAEGGHPGAAYTYGVLLMKGQGVNKNAAMARKWLTIAKERGVQQAQKALNALGPDS
jgi:hypothetical protein